jgi:uncharacterized protein YkwD
MTPAMKRHALTCFAVLVTALSAAAPAQAGARLDRTERSILRLINAQRGQNGLGGLRASGALSRAADAHSRDMAGRGFFDHTSSDGTSFNTRVRRYTRMGTIGETLAVTSRRRGAASGVVAMWMSSAPHRAIVLHPGFSRVGVALRWGAGKALVTADFGG